jgi:hypothetical protein
MSDIHMGKTLERMLRQHFSYITEVAIEVGVDRRTLYNWFNKEYLSPSIMSRFSKSMIFNPYSLGPIQDATIDLECEQTTSSSNDIWKHKYLILLERHNDLLRTQLLAKRS